MNNIYLIPIIIITVLYLFFLFFGKKSKLQSSERFKKSKYDNSWLILPSALATNLTISGGIIASISGSKYYGYWFMLAPISFVCGFFLFIIFHNKLSKLYTNKQLFISDIIGDKKSPMMLSFSIASIVVGIFLAGWEIHIASLAIAKFYGTKFAFIQNNTFLIAIAIAIMAGIYITRGGWERSVITDIFQSIGVLIFLGLLTFTLINLTTSQDSKFEYALTHPNNNIKTISIWLFGLALFINNIGYSLINPNNWQVAQSSGNLSKKIFYTAGTILFVFFTIVYLLAGLIPSNNPFSIFEDVNIQTAILVSGIPLFVWSTIDTSSVALSHLADDILTKYSNTPKEYNEELRELVRINYPLIFLISVVLVSYILNILNPNLFQTLLGATSSLIVFVPVIYLALFTKNNSYLFSVKCSIQIFSLFLLVIIVSAILTITGLGEYIFGLSIAGFLISLALIINNNKERID